MKRQKPDYILLGCVVILTLVGLAALLSASVTESQRDFGDIYTYFRHQLIYGVGLGAIAGFLAYRIHYKNWRRLALPVLLIAVFLLILVFIHPFSLEAGGARRWVSIGGISFQPSEFAKLAFIIYLAAWLEARKSIVRRWNEGLVPFLIIVGMIGALIARQPDVGTLGVIALTAGFMYFIAGASLAQMGAIFTLGLGALFALAKIAPYRYDRLTAFFNNSIDPLGISYQINQALMAIGSGGILGMGLGKGLQKYAFLPEPMKDSIFAVWSEEMGFIGGVLILALFLIIGLRGLRIANVVNDRFGKMLAFGITFWIIFQAFTNIGSMIGIIPLTGIPLPFVSYGGSSMVAVFIAFGILLNISRRT